jgi:hypothetical protein
MSARWLAAALITQSTVPVMMTMNQSERAVVSWWCYVCMWVWAGDWGRLWLWFVSEHPWARAASISINRQSSPCCRTSDVGAKVAPDEPPPLAQHLERGTLASVEASPIFLKILKNQYFLNTCRLPLTRRESPQACSVRNSRVLYIEKSLEKFTCSCCTSLELCC